MTGRQRIALEVFAVLAIPAVAVVLAAAGTWLGWTP